MSEKKSYMTKCSDAGCLNISEDVIASVAALAIRDVEGVYVRDTKSVSEMLGFKAGKEIKVVCGEETVTVDCTICVKYGAPIVEVAKNVQAAVKSAVESMTGLTVSAANVHIGGIAVIKNQA